MMSAKARTAPSLSQLDLANVQRSEIYSLGAHANHVLGKQVGLDQHCKSKIQNQLLLLKYEMRPYSVRRDTHRDVLRTAAV